MGTRKTRKSHPANVPGDFYVEDGCCLFCGMPEQEAPDIFGWAGPSPSHCVVKRQPQTLPELDRTFNAMSHGDVDCVRYRGNDRDIRHRLVARGLAKQCDVL